MLAIKVTYKLATVFFLPLRIGRIEEKYSRKGVRLTFYPSLYKHAIYVVGKIPCVIDFHYYAATGKLRLRWKNCFSVVLNTCKKLCLAAAMWVVLVMKSVSPLFVDNWGVRFY